MVSEALGQEPVKKTTLNAEFAEHAEKSSDFLCDLSGLSVPPGLCSAQTGNARLLTAWRDSL